MLAKISMLLIFKNVLMLLIHVLEFLKILAILLLVSYKPVSRKKTCRLPSLFVLL